MLTWVRYRTAGNLAALMGSGVPLPVNTVAPAVTGTETSGSTLTVSNGTWTGSPTSYTYQWYRAITSGGSIVTSGGLYTGNAIGSATASTYVLTNTDIGELIYAEVTAHNAGGDTMAQSNATGAIGAGSPLSFTSLFVGDPGSMVVSSGKVASWGNLQPGGVTLTQADSAKRPTYSSGAVFDGTALYLENTSFPMGGGTTLSVFALFSYDSDVANNAGIVVFSANGHNDFQNVDSGVLINTNSPNQIYTYRVGDKCKAISLSAATLYRYGVIFDGTNAVGYLNNSNSIFTPSAASTGSFGTTGTLNVGARLLPTASAQYFKGTIKKLVVTTTALNSTQRDELDAWLLS